MLDVEGGVLGGPPVETGGYKMIDVCIGIPWITSNVALN